MYALKWQIIIDRGKEHGIIYLRDQYCFALLGEIETLNIFSENSIPNQPRAFAFIFNYNT